MGRTSQIRIKCTDHIEEHAKTETVSGTETCIQQVVELSWQMMAFAA